MDPGNNFTFSWDLKFNNFFLKTGSFLNISPITEQKWKIQLAAKDSLPPHVQIRNHNANSQGSMLDSQRQELRETLQKMDIPLGHKE